MLLLPPLKAKKYEIKSNKTPLEAYKILKSMTKSAATSFDTCDFIGDIGFPDFQIRPHFPFIKDSVSPILHGKISKSEEKAKIIIEVSTFLAIPVILCYIFSLILLIMGIGLFDYQFVSPFLASLLS